MNNLFVYLLFGHLFGDYFFQNNWMAQSKKKKGFEGTLACFIHCFMYTVIIIGFLSVIPYSLSASQVILIFLSHWILDRYDFIQHWCEINGIRSWKSEIEGKDMNDPATVRDSVNISFGAFVNTVQDNTLHLFLMWLILILL